MDDLADGPSVVLGRVRVDRPLVGDDGNCVTDVVMMTSVVPRPPGKLGWLLQWLTWRVFQFRAAKQHRGTPLGDQYRASLSYKCDVDVVEQLSRIARESEARAIVAKYDKRGIRRIDVRLELLEDMLAQVFEAEDSERLESEAHRIGNRVAALYLAGIMASQDLVGKLAGYDRGSGRNGRRRGPRADARAFISRFLRSAGLQDARAAVRRKQGRGSSAPSPAVLEEDRLWARELEKIEPVPSPVSLLRVFLREALGWSDLQGVENLVRAMEWEARQAGGGGELARDLAEVLSRHRVNVDGVCAASTSAALPPFPWKAKDSVSPIEMQDMWAVRPWVPVDSRVASKAKGARRPGQGTRAKAEPARGRPRVSS